MRHSFLSLSFAVALDAIQSNITSKNVSAFVVPPRQNLVYVNPLHAVSVEPLSQLTAPDDVTDAPLMRDIEMLNNMLAEVVERDNPVVHDLYTRFRRHGLNRATNPDDPEPLQRMIRCAKDISPENALGVMRTFALALNLVNAAEVCHRLRGMRRKDLDATESFSVGPLPAVEDSVCGTINAIMRENEKRGVPDERIKEAIYEKLICQKVELVLTAHPTEVNRRTVLSKYRKISETLATLDRLDLNPFERRQTLIDLRRLIATLWGTNEIRSTKPTPQQEASGGIAIIESVLWDAVPAYVRKLDAQCRLSLDRGLPLTTVPIKFGSWIGGDRDGNPNVTPEVTHEVVTHQRLRAAKLFLSDLNELYNELPICGRFSSNMTELAASIIDSPDRMELYRRVIGHLRQRLVKTIKECEHILSQNPASIHYIMAETSNYKLVGGWETAEPIYKAQELMRPLLVMHDSLVQTGFELVADGLLVDIIRRLSIFGMTLVPLDIREESTRHKLALDAITKYLGLGSYADWDEATKLKFLEAELAGKRPLFRTTDLDSLGFDESVLKTLDTFRMLSGLEPESFGAYVISQAQTASDVLAVMLLQKQFGMEAEKNNMLRVVPLFETLDDLTNASAVISTLFSIPSYTRAIKGKQEVMVGYSDSAKDAGRLAACWALYESQEKMAEVAKKFNVELTFFHGKGGTVGRGGNPALYRAVLSHPPNTINGRFRVTEQGEMITQNFGSIQIAERTLDIYSSAVLRESFIQHVDPTKEWRSLMQRVSDVSCTDYRHIVREEPSFVPYFRQATPELELGRLNIGSRPAKRNPKGGIESLRAIPWTFAWTQTRLHLSAWLGVGEGLNLKNENDRKMLVEMYQKWPWFRETVDLLTMILSKTDFSISKNYEDQLVERKEELIKLGVNVRRKLEETRRAVLAVQQSKSFKGPHVQIVRASSTIRAPYIDPINIVQAELLKRLRSMDENGEESEEKTLLSNALLVSINGIAQGLRNSG